jgi:hypothetical protein
MMRANITKNNEKIVKALAQYTACVANHFMLGVSFNVLIPWHLQHHHSQVYSGNEDSNLQHQKEIGDNPKEFVQETWISAKSTSSHHYK